MSDNSRFSCLKPESKNVFRQNRFNNTNRENSRWKRSNSPKKFNSFTSRGNDRRRNNNRRNFRNNKRKDIVSKKFHNVEKDAKGRPILRGATNNSFNPFEVAMKKMDNKKQKKEKIIKVEPKKKINNDFKIDDNLTVYQKKSENGFKTNKLSDIEKQMILNMQYETESESENEEEEDVEDDN